MRSPPILARRPFTWLSTVRVPEAPGQSQTSAISWSRETTVPGLAARQTSRSNSVGVSRTSSSPRHRPPRTRVEPQVAELERTPSDELGGALDPTQQRRDAGDQLPHAERLGEVVVGADAEPGQHVGLLDARGQHDHRHRTVGLDPPADLEAVVPGEHHVEDDEVGLVLAVRRDRARPVVRPDDVVPLGDEPVGDRLVDHRVVLDDEDPTARAAHGRRLRARSGREIGTTCGGSVQVSLTASSSALPELRDVSKLLRTPRRKVPGEFDVGASPHRPGAVTAQEIPMTTTQLPRTAYAPVRQADPRPGLRRVAGGSVVAALAGAVVLFAYGAAAVAIHGPMQVGDPGNTAPITAASFAIGVLFSSFFGVAARGRPRPLGQAPGPHLPARGDRPDRRLALRAVHRAHGRRHAVVPGPRPRPRGIRDHPADRAGSQRRPCLSDLARVCVSARGPSRVRSARTPRGPSRRPR